LAPVSRAICWISRGSVTFFQKTAELFCFLISLMSRGNAGRCFHLGQDALRPMADPIGALEIPEALWLSD
jgi:hypothetical protein